MESGVPLGSVFALEDDDRGRSLAELAGAPLLSVTAEVLARVSTTDTPQSPVAVIDIPEPSTAPGGRVLVAWGVADPGNCGTLIRTAAALSYGYLAGPDTADTWSPKVLRSAAGGHFRTAIGEAPDPGSIRSGGRVLVGTVATGGVRPGPLPPNAAVLVGSEAHGLPDDVLAEVDVLVTIPMAPGTESLNAAVAGAIVAYVGSRES